MDTSRYIFNGSKKFTMAAIKTDEATGVKTKAAAAQRLEHNHQRIDEYQELLYADGSQGLLVVLQGMDASGKDGAIRHVFSGVNPEGIRVANFKQPSAAEQAHDYLWRVHAEVPPRGSVGIFNRSHYEEVLVSRVLDLPRQQNLPKRALRQLWPGRYRQIGDFEQYLYENGITILKFYLHLSKEEQTKRFAARIDDPAKNWKFSTGDLVTSERWDDYMKAYRECINATATPFAPWVVVPADKKWFARLLISEVVADTLKKMKPAHPEMTKAQRQELEQARAMLKGVPAAKAAKKAAKKLEKAEQAQQPPPEPVSEKPAPPAAVPEATEPPAVPGPLH